MMSNVLKFCIGVVGLMVLPTNAVSVDLGVVQLPAYLDWPIVAAGLAFALLVTRLRRAPSRGLDFHRKPRPARGSALRIWAPVSIVSLISAMGLVFVVMGLQSAAW